MNGKTKNNRSGINQAELKKLLDYDEDSGVFTFLPRSAEYFSSSRGMKIWNARFSGKPAGCADKGGYIKIMINYQQYTGHRLAVLYMLGFMPEYVDHINHDKHDNRWKNLRPVTHQENQQNTKLSKTNTSGFNGVSWDNSRNKWAAYIWVDYVKKFLGRYSSKSDAINARKKAEIDYNFHHNHGK